MKRVKNGNLFTVLKDLKAFSTATTMLLCFIYLPFTKILWLFLEPLETSSVPIKPYIVVVSSAFSK